MRRHSVVPVALTALLMACNSDAAEPGVPTMETSTAGVIVGPEVDTASFVLRSTGTAPVEWRAVPVQGWVTTEPSSGVIAVADSAHVIVRADKLQIAYGTSASSVRIDANVVAPSQHIAVQVTKPPKPIIQLDGGDTVLAYPQTRGRIVLRNIGQGPLTWTPVIDQNWLRIGDVSGSSGTGQSWSVEYIVDRVSTRDVIATITFISDALNGPLTVPIRVVGAPAPQYFVLPEPVIDATYSVDSRQVMALHGSTVTAWPWWESTARTVALPLPAHAIEKGRDQVFVAHDSAVSILNPESLVADTTIALGFTPAAIAHTWLYTDPWLPQLLYMVPRNATSARVVALRGSDLAMREVLAPLPPLQDVATVSTIYGAAAFEGGLVQLGFDEDGWPSFHEPVAVAYPAGDVSITGFDYDVITSAGELYRVDAPTITAAGLVTWPDAAPVTGIRWAHQEWIPDSDPLLIRPHDPGAPPDPHVYILRSNMELHVVELLPLDWHGSPLPIQPHYVFGFLEERLLVVIGYVRDQSGTTHWIGARVWY